jgi:hypothetical protein
MSYREKYIKYKNKYLNLKNQAGGVNYDCNHELYNDMSIKDICHADQKGIFKNKEECTFSKKCTDKWTDRKIYRWTDIKMIDRIKYSFEEYEDYGNSIYPIQNSLYQDYGNFIFNFLQTEAKEEQPIPFGNNIKHPRSGIIFRPQKKYNLEFIKNNLKPYDKYKDIYNFINLESFELTLIPRGRMFSGIIRDDRFLVNMNTILNSLEQLNNTMFLNYTGHLSSFATSLLSHGISCIWQIPQSALISNNIFKEGYHINDRVLDQLQDTINSKLSYKITNESSFGIVLEAQHGLSKTILINKLPSKAILKQKKINKIIVFTEWKFNPTVKQLEEVKIMIGDLYPYLKSLENDFAIGIYTTDPDK